MIPRLTTSRLAASVAALMIAAPAAADCGIASGSVRILSNDFPALHAVAAAAEECASGSVSVTKNQTTDHEAIQVAALTTDPATYSVAIVANSSILPLLNAGLIRPLDDYVAEYGQELTESQLIRVGGKIMAIAFMANAQHLWYRSDILAEAGLQPPASYEAVLENAEAIRAQGLLANPLAATFQPGWNLGEEFVNMYIGYGGEFFRPGTAELAIQNEKGVSALETMKALAGYMSPDFVTYDSNQVQALWEAGEAAMANFWASRAGPVIDPAGDSPAIGAVTVLAAAPVVGGGDVPATTLWWDGFAIAQNISDEDAEASFRAMLHGTAPEVARANPNAAAWLIKGYEPTAAAVGVLATIEAGARPYPMTPYMGLLHTALGDELAGFMQGQESAEQALTDVARAYETAAREAGFLK